MMPCNTVHLFLGTFPPRQCGIATFTKDMVSALDRSSGSFSEVVAVDDALPGVGHGYSGRVVCRLQQHDRSSYSQLASFIDGHSSDTLNVQHEFGIYGGDDGKWLLDLLERLRKPIVVTLHTVLPNPSPGQFAVTTGLAAAARRLVVLSETASSLLQSRYGIDSERIRAIPHGIPDVEFAAPERFKPLFGFDERFVISTFGLLSRGKGLETALDAVALAAARRPDILYVILGATHPVVARNEGETYREELRARVRRLGIERNVLMVDQYLNIADLLLYLGASDAYVTPYLSPNQIVSGTLAYALGCGKPVVSTPYLYARELLADDRGLIVPFEDPISMGDAFLALANNDAFRREMARRAYELSRPMTWDKVGTQYSNLLEECHENHKRLRDRPSVEPVRHRIAGNAR